MFKPFLRICIGLFILPTFAQTDNDPLYVNYSFFPSRDMQEANDQSTYSQLETNVILPGFKPSKSTIIYTNLNYKLSNYNFENTDSNVFPNQLNDIRLGFIIRQKITQNWEAIIAPRLNVRTDFEEKFSKRDIFPSVHLLGLRTSPKNENLIYGLGISYNNEATKNLVIPLLFLQYKTEDFRAYTIIPSFAYFMMTPSEKFEYGLSLNLESAMFHVERFSMDNSPNYLRTQNITIAPTLGYQFAKDIWFNFRAGYALPGKYQLLNADFDELPGMEDNKFKGGFSAMAGVSLRVKEKAD